MHLRQSPALQKPTQSASCQALADPFLYCFFFCLLRLLIFFSDFFESSSHTAPSLKLTHVAEAGRGRGCLPLVFMTPVLRLQVYPVTLPRLEKKKKERKPFLAFFSSSTSFFCFCCGCSALSFSYYLAILYPKFLLAEQVCFKFKLTYVSNALGSILFKQYILSL